MEPGSEGGGAADRLRNSERFFLISSSEAAFEAGEFDGFEVKGYEGLLALDCGCCLRRALTSLK